MRCSARGWLLDARRISALVVVTCVLGGACRSRSDARPSSSSSIVESTVSAPAPTADAGPPSPASFDLSILAVDPESGEQLKRDVDYLASPELAGRATGEEGGRLASALIEKRFSEVGLAPFGDILSKNDPSNRERGFVYRFSALTNAKIAPPQLSVVSAEVGAGARSALPIDVTAAALRTADGSASGTVSGEAVFAGWGITTQGWDDYDGADLTGKIAVVLRGAPAIANLKPRDLFRLATFRQKIRTALAHKAVGLVVISRTNDLPLDPIEPRSAGLPAVVVKRSVAERFFSASGVPSAKSWLAKSSTPPQPLPGVRIKLTTEVTSLDRWANDVVGLLPAREGSSTPDEWVVLGAHYDHVGLGGRNLSMAPWLHAIHPGADDNASGTALLLDVARRLTHLPRRPSRNIVFIAFGAEELGLLGSHAWVDDPPIPLGRIAAMVNADMVGRLRKNTLTIENTKGNGAWKKVFDDANQGIGLGLDLTPSNEFIDRSDQGPFDAEKVPAVMLFTGLHPDYHRPSDTADKVELAGLETISTFAARVVLDLAERGFPR